MKKILIKIIRLYQRYLSPDHSHWAQSRKHPPYCRYYPTCSQYTIEAIEKKGAFLGLIKGFGRILRCMPRSKGGYDPVDKK